MVLAEYHYYDGTTFHRVIPGYVVQGGDATGKPPGTGTPGYTIADEFPKSLSDYTAGSVAMANTGAAHSGRLPVLHLGRAHALPGPNYSLFGQVSSGMATVTKIVQAGSPTGTPSQPVTHRVGDHRPGRPHPPPEAAGPAPPPPSGGEAHRQVLALRQGVGDGGRRRARR